MNAMQVFAVIIVSVWVIITGLLIYLHHVNKKDLND